MDSGKSISEQRLEPFLNLWKTSEQKWLEKREADWTILKKSGFIEGSKEYISKCEEYFLSGRYSGYIDPLTKFLLTPLESSVDAKEFFHSDNYDVNDRERLMYSFLKYRNVEPLGLFKRQAKFFVDGIMTTQYRFLSEQHHNGPAVYSVDPTSWCRGFVVIGLDILRGKHEYHGYMEAVDFFLSALAHADDPENRPYKRFDKFIAAIDEAITNPNLSEDAIVFAKTLSNKKQEIIDTYALNAHVEG